MRLPPPTLTMYCSNPACVHATGISVRWTPDSIDGPGWPKRDSCPKCACDLMYGPHPDEEGEW